MLDIILRILAIVVPAALTIIIAIIENRAAKDRKAAAERDARAEERAKLREKESRLSMKMLDATLQLSIVSANALTNHQNNGNVERARAAAQAAQIEYHDFLQEIAAHEVSK